MCFRYAVSRILLHMFLLAFCKCVIRPQVNLAYQSGMMFSMVDNNMGSYPSECVEQFVSLALRCCQDETEKRPSMAEVVRELESIWRMTPESDSVPSESISTNPGKTMTPPTSSTSANPFVSSDVSGSDLLSGVIPTIAPRWCHYRYSYILFKFACMYYGEIWTCSNVIPFVICCSDLLDKREGNNLQC